MMKQFVSLVVLITVFAGTIGVVSAQSLAYFGVEDTIRTDQTVHNVIRLHFGEPIEHLDYQLGFRVFNLSTEQSFNFATCLPLNTGTASRITCDFIGMTRESNQLTLTFDTPDQVRDTGANLQFTGNYRISLPVENSFVLITLPEGEDTANVEKPYSPEGAQFLTTDGRTTSVFWELNNVSADDPLEFMVAYTRPDAILPGFPVDSALIVVLTIAVLLTMIAVVSYVRKAYVHKDRVASQQEVVKAVLNQDENMIVDIVAKNGGKVNQRVIVRESEFSKAKVSRLVKSLKERGILDVEPVGRTNRVMLKELVPKKDAEQQEGQSSSSPT